MGNLGLVHLHHHHHHHHLCLLSWHLASPRTPLHTSLYSVAGRIFTNIHQIKYPRGGKPPVTPLSWVPKPADPFSLHTHLSDHLSCPRPSRHTSFLSNSRTFQAHPSLRALRPTTPTRTRFLGIDPCSHTGAWARRGPTLCLMLCSRHLGIFNRFEGGPTFSFCPAPHESCAQSCLYLEHSALGTSGSFSHPGRLGSDVTSSEGPSLATCPKEPHPWHSLSWGTSCEILDQSRGSEFPSDVSS